MAGHYVIFLGFVVSVEKEISYLLAEKHTFFLKTVLEANRLQLFVEAKPWISSPNYGIHYARQDYIRLLTHHNNL